MHNAFAHQLLKLRTEQQLSQTDIANLLFVSRQAVSKWENGDTEPNLDNLIALARILNVSLENLITGSSNPNSLLLTLSHVSKSFSKPVLKDVNLTVHSHERIALLGANGAGKTTLIQIIIGLINPDKGTVKFDLDPKKSLNIMPQENVLIPDITVLEQIKLVSLINKVYNEENIQNLLAKFSLIDQSNQLIQKLSGGQKRRLSLLISSLRPAKLSILDEPTVGMDLDSIDFFWKLLNSRNESTIVVTHDFNQIDRYFSRVLLLKGGRKISFRYLFS
ncbi:XRE family transcriptional regulator [Limosilactobacillus reuteri]|uniref:XRE family transcriptional regulator n=3 Tax=Limosilactobacillus reuteri TaxID=1598 RepID=A0AAW9ZMS8_LIMRT|nr:XRE family transcriptional regulator [Limosilactobacillus reuteri]MCI7590535.1 XRE family transcriptional regulator [Lactobacillus johnsonii]MDY2688400.1 XRE family transcriptional regulator [Limosilactobacillus reuteri]NME23073.1 XRE family transcriptional regulator [Limosilactobacillus reuteri]OTA48602.1 ABC transporter [Limosilactobacillus reuteri]OTA53929.1 ABC transporter [Limosilactobacillus reuteri]